VVSGRVVVLPDSRRPEETRIGAGLRGSVWILARAKAFASGFTTTSSVGSLPSAG
jgi:hypothetical protein